MRIAGLGLDASVSLALRRGYVRGGHVGEMLQLQFGTKTARPEL